MAKLRRKRKYAVALAVLFFLWAILPPGEALGYGVLANRSFATNLSNWATNGSIHSFDSAGYTGWLSNAGNNYQSVGGSLRFAVTGNNANSSGYLEQAFNVPISNPQVRLSFAWRKSSTTTPSTHTIQVQIIRPGGSTVTPWEHTATGNVAWQAVQDVNLSSHFTEIGTYTIRLRAQLAHGTGNPITEAWFDEVYLEVNSSIASPSNQQVQDSGTGGVLNLSWNSVGGAQGYNIYRTTNPAGTYTKVNGSPVTGTSFADSGLTNGTTYYYKIVTVDGAGYESLKGAAVSGAPTTWKTSGVPTGLAISNPGTGNSLNLSWNSVTGASGYNVYRATAADGPYTKINGSLVAGTAYADSGLTEGVTYFYKVSAVRSSDSLESNLSAQQSGTPATAPAVPAGLTVTNPGTGNSLTLSWSANSEPNLAGYNVYRSTSAGGTYTKVNGAPITVTSYYDNNNGSGLAEAVTYYYRITAANTAGLESAQSAYVSGTTHVLNGPAGLTVTNPGTGGTLHISWQSSGVGDLAGYNIYRSTTASGPYEKLNSNPLVTTSYTDDNLVNGMTYYYKVAAENLAGLESDYSGPVPGTPSLASPPPTPTGLSAESTGTGFSLVVRWNAVSDPDLAGYNLYRAESAGGPYGKVNSETLLTTNYLDSGLTEGQPYYYRVAAVNIFAMESELSATASAVPDYFEFSEQSGYSFSAITGGDSFVHLEWDTIRGAAQYRVLRSTNGVDWLEAYSGGALEYTDNGLTNYVNYYYKLEASDGEGTVTSAVARAFPPNTSPHGFFNQQTTLCASCHVAHSASGPKLMLAATQVALCTTCHDGTASKYDVLNGTVVVPGGGVKPSPAGPFGWLAVGVGDVDVPAGYSYTAGAVNVSEEPTSIHRLGTRNDQAPGSNISNTFIAMDQLSCGHCHDVHGSDNYRILRRNMRTTISHWAPPVSVIAYAETTEEGEEVNYLSGSVYFCGSCHSDFNQWSGSGKKRVRSTKQEGYILSNESEDLFMHAVNVPNSYKGLPSDETLPYENGHIICLTCHFAHGTKAQGPSPLRSGEWSTALKRFDEMEGCENCHDKTNFPYHP